MKAELDPKVKRLYAALLRTDMPSYLITDRFDHVCLENNVDELWERCERHIRSLSNVAILIPGYTGDAEEALGVFLSELLKNRDTFLSILDQILKDFFDWKKNEVDKSEIFERLLELGFSKDQVSLMQIFKEREELSAAEVKPIGTMFFTKRVEKIEEDLCFVLMPFDEKFRPIYDTIMKPTIEHVPLRCVRSDEIFGTRPVMEDVWENIQKARILLADLTGKNPNVLYELGLAHALGKNVVLMTQNLDDVPFDLRHYRCIIYQDSISGADLLKKGISETIKSALSW